MRNKGYTVRKKTGLKKVENNKTADEILNEIRKGITPPKNDYREQSLRIHGLICAKCAREFSDKDRHLLTVHHRDGNSRNNPPDGSNWENLCVYCHDDEHSRGLLGDYFSENK
ncbi:MAG: YajD family HNH nuclease [Proteobacteria bacterium]|nr:YajD family HNH nuclease [Pseudomonadota bacterium]